MTEELLFRYSLSVSTTLRSLSSNNTVFGSFRRFSYSCTFTSTGFGGSGSGAGLDLDGYREAISLAGMFSAVR